MTRLIVAEPSTAYARRPRIVVDASLLAAVAFAEPEMELALAWMHGRALCAPSLVVYEMTNASLSKVKRRSMTAASAAAALAAFAALDLERFDVEPVPVFELAARYGLTACDAAYLWLAAELGASLATFDSRLGAAARQHLG